ncbi:MAG TPA: carboxylesterase family protein [Dehalococcoidia bacterium]|nr:carboxylesterase family protein [Dehalococcoidia bacterium]
MYRKGKSNRFKLLLPLLLLSVLTLLIAVSCNGETSSEGTPAATGTDLLVDPVKVDGGYIAGTQVGEPGKEVHVYRGVPYAAAPIGDLRWKPPQPVEPWSGIREATVFSSMCPQRKASWVLGTISEDCLYLNVFTPAEKTSERLPVMVWFHGGGYAVGSANQLPYTWPALPQHGVVMVGVNHRLGPIGLLALPELSKESPNGVSGNYMFLDLIAALQWVQTNIADFGGDPNNVTIFGESGGGGKADALMASPLAKGLFQRAILESGANSERVGIRGVRSLEEAEALGEQLVAKLGIPEDGDVLAALRATPYEQILEASADLSRELAEGMPVGEGSVLDNLVVDGWFMTDTPANVFRAGEQNDVDLITSTNLGELTVENTVVYVPYLIGAYTIRLTAVGESGNNAYAALFTHVPSKWREEGILAFHSLELPYVFGLLAVLPNSVYYNAWAQPSGVQSQDPGLTEDDQRLSEAMMTMWTQFAKTGNPSVEGLIDWPTWDPANDQYLDIAWPLEVKSGYSKIVPSE